MKASRAKRLRRRTLRGFAGQLGLPTTVPLPPDLAGARLRLSPLGKIVRPSRKALTRRILRDRGI